MRFPGIIIEIEPNVIWPHIEKLLAEKRKDFHWWFRGLKRWIKGDRYYCRCGKIIRARILYPIPNAYKKCTCGELAELSRKKYSLLTTIGDTFVPFQDLRFGRKWYSTKREAIANQGEKDGKVYKLMRDEEIKEMTDHYRKKALEENKKMHERELEFYSEKLARGEHVIGPDGRLIKPEV